MAKFWSSFSGTKKLRQKDTFISILWCCNISSNLARWENGFSILSDSQLSLYSRGARDPRNRATRQLRHTRYFCTFRDLWSTRKLEAAEISEVPDLFKYNIIIFFTMIGYIGVCFGELYAILDTFYGVGSNNS